MSTSSPLLASPPEYGVPATPYIILPIYPRRRLRRPSCCSSLLSSSSLLLLSFLSLLLLSVLFFAFPSDPDLSLSRISLLSIQVNPQPPRPSLDVSLSLVLRVRNPDFYSLDYRSLNVSILYRGKHLGSVVVENEGRVRARGVSFVEAEVKLDGIEVLNDVFYLIEDLARGALPLDTVTVVDGTMKLFFLSFSVKGKVSCAIIVNPQTQKVIRQDCYPE